MKVLHVYLLTFFPLISISLNAQLHNDQVVCNTWQLQALSGLIKVCRFIYVPVWAPKVDIHVVITGSNKLRSNKLSYFIITVNTVCISFIRPLQLEFMFLGPDRPI